MKKPKKQKSSSRVGEKADLNGKHEFLTDLEMSKSSSRVGESSIFKILQENEKWKQAKGRPPLEAICWHLLGSILGPFWDKKSIKHLSLFQTSFSEAFWCKS